MTTSSTKSAWSLSKTANDIAVLQINCPGEKLNVLSTPVMQELSDLLDEIDRHSGDYLGLVITSSKPGCFIAGADIREIAGLQKRAVVESFNATQLGKAIYKKIAELPFPTVAAINGLCLGGGLELVLACSHRIASQNAKLGFPEVKLGLLPGWGGCIRTPVLIGLANALDLILHPDKTVDGKTAWKMGLVDEIWLDATDSRLLDRAEDVACEAEVRRAKRSVKQQLANWFYTTRLGRFVVNKKVKGDIYKDTRGNFPAPYAALKVVMASGTLSEDQAGELESSEFAKLAHTDVSRNLVGLYFADQEAKKVPDGVKPVLEIETVGVLGGGVMGAGIAQACLYAGYDVVLYDLFPESLAKGRQTIVDLFDNLLRIGKLSQPQLNEIMNRLITTTNYAPLSNCQLVIEAVVEDMAIKKQNREAVENAIGRPFIFASNTSSLDIDDMMSDARYPELTAGLHFFNPVHKMPLIEIVHGARTSEATRATLLAFTGSLKKIGVTTANRPGFVVNDILTPYMLEAIQLVQQGVPAEDVDKAMLTFGMRMGPITLIDEVGLDVAIKVAHVLHEAYGDRVRLPDIVEWIYKRNNEIAASNKTIRAENELAKKEGRETKPELTMLLGRKTGKGIFLYGEKGERQDLNPEVVKALDTKPTHKSKEEIQDRLVLVMINEAARCLSAGVVSSASQIDFAMILGTGYPPFRGGILRVADKMGLKLVVQKLHALAQESGEAYVPCELLVQMAQEGRTFYPN